MAFEAIKRATREGNDKDSRVSQLISDTLGEMVEEDLIAERVAIQSCSGMIRFIGDADPTTPRMLEALSGNRA